jgi:uncharacterized membrane protein (DUF106 family)
MFHNFWLVFKEFCTNHAEHVVFEQILLILAILVGAFVVLFSITFMIKINKNIREMNKTIKKSKKASDKKILLLLKQKKNKTF